jgi:mannose/cellobiose epimerase-like protein (N-acyl-D-glucosamine 2-epimerase family)
MLETEPDPEIEKIAARSVDSIMNRHYNPAFGLTSELLNHDFSRPGPPYDQMVATGHSIETLWMVLYEAVRRKDRKLFDEAARRFRYHVEVATDRIYGGVFHDLTNVDRNLWRVEKVLWAQEEVLVGALWLVEHTGAAWARDLFANQYAYVREKYPLKKHGFSGWINQGDRKVTFVEHYNRVENFHHPRHLMLNILALDRMIERGGKPSGVWA